MLEKELVNSLTYRNSLATKKKTPKNGFIKKVSRFTRQFKEKKKPLSEEEKKRIEGGAMGDS